MVVPERCLEMIADGGCEFPANQRGHLAQWYGNLGDDEQMTTLIRRRLNRLALIPGRSRY